MIPIELGINYVLISQNYPSQKKLIASSQLKWLKCVRMHRFLERAKVLTVIKGLVKNI